MKTKAEQHYHGLRKWLFMETLLPVFFMVGLYWPVGMLIRHPEHWFYRVFASSDLEPLAAIILLAAACEIEQNRLYAKISSGWLETYRHGAISLSIIFLFLYGFCKNEFLVYTFDDSQPVSDNIFCISIVSIVSIVVAVLLSAVTKLHTIALVQNITNKVIKP